MKTTLITVILTSLAAGCAHYDRCQTMVFQDAVRLVPASTNLDAIRYPAVYKAYPVGRMVDPHNRDVMHDAHVIYVRQCPDFWNLHPLTAPAVPLGPTVAPTNGAYAPLPLGDELRLELNAQKQATKSVQEQAQRLGQAAEKLTPLTDHLLQQQIDVQQRLRLSDERLRRLEEEMRRSQTLPGPLPVPRTNTPAPGW